MEEAKKKILITGAGGMLGYDLIQCLKDEYLIAATDLNYTQVVEGTFYQADITDIDSIGKVFETVNPWIVIHAAAYTNVDKAESDPESAYKVNVTGTANIADLCKKFNSGLISISTDYVFDGKKQNAYLETDTTSPETVYGKTKLEAEKKIFERLDKAVVIRTSWLFGVRGRNFVKTIRDKARLEKKVSVVNDQIGCPTYTLSLAVSIRSMIIRIFKAEDDFLFGIYNVSNQGKCSWFDFAKLIIEFYGIDAAVLPVNTESMKRPARRPAFSLLDNGKIESLVQVKNCSWQDALKQYIKQEELFDKNME